MSGNDEKPKTNYLRCNCRCGLRYKCWECYSGNDKIVLYLNSPTYSKTNYVGLVNIDIDFEELYEDVSILDRALSYIAIIQCNNCGHQVVPDTAAWDTLINYMRKHWPERTVLS